jgi:hypothetical protein
MKDDEEVRVTSATGGQKGSKLAQFAALDPRAITELAKVAGFGAQKYSQHNFLRGYDWSLSANAASRHFLAWLGGEDVDPESGLSHLAHAMWNLHTLIAFQSRGLGTDDRPTAANLAALVGDIEQLAERERGPIRIPAPLESQQPSEERAFMLFPIELRADDGIRLVTGAPSWASGVAEVANFAELGPWYPVEAEPERAFVGFFDVLWHRNGLEVGDTKVCTLSDGNTLYEVKNFAELGPWYPVEAVEVGPKVGDTLRTEAEFAALPVGARVEARGLPGEYWELTRHGWVLHSKHHVALSAPKMLRGARKVISLP